MSDYMVADDKELQKYINDTEIAKHIAPPDEKGRKGRMNWGDVDLWFCLHSGNSPDSYWFQQGYNSDTSGSYWHDGAKRAVEEISDFEYKLENTPDDGSLQIWFCNKESYIAIVKVLYEQDAELLEKLVMTYNVMRIVNPSTKQY